MSLAPPTPSKLGWATPRKLMVCPVNTSSMSSESLRAKGRIRTVFKVRKPEEGMDEQPVFGECYRLIWRTTGDRSLGEVRNYTADKKGFRRVPVLLDEELMKRIHMRFLVTSWGKQGPEVTVGEAFQCLPQDFRDAGIWHEIGHIHHEHNLKLEFSDQTRLRMARIAALKKGQVMPIEIEADQFAVTRIGKEALIGFLTHALRSRPTGGKQGWNDLGRRELELRIRIIQAL